MERYCWAGMFAPRVYVSLAACSTPPKTGRTKYELLRAMIDAGIDVIGGCGQGRAVEFHRRAAVRGTIKIKGDVCWDRSPTGASLYIRSGVVVYRPLYPRSRFSICLGSGYYGYRAPVICAGCGIGNQ